MPKKITDTITGQRKLPTHLLAVLSKALGTSTDELLGINKTDINSKKKICASGVDLVKSEKWM